jgi:hypothetical protein
MLRKTGSTQNGTIAYDGSQNACLVQEPGHYVLLVGEDIVKVWLRRTIDIADIVTAAQKALDAMLPAE